MCDFGVSEMFARKGDDRVKKGMGSPAFMSPESVEGGQEMGAKMADGEFMRLASSDQNQLELIPYFLARFP